MPHPNLEPVMSSGPRPWVRALNDSEMQQAWWASMTPEQQEDYEDGIARRKAQRDRTRTKAAKRQAVERRLARRNKYGEA